MSTTTIATAEAWTYLVDAVLCSISDEPNEARHCLYMAEHALGSPLPDAAHRAVLDAEYENEDAAFWQGMAEGYKQDAESIQNHANHLSGQLNGLRQLLEREHPDLLKQFDSEQSQGIVAMLDALKGMSQ